MKKLLLSCILAFNLHGASNSDQESSNNTTTDQNTKPLAALEKKYNTKDPTKLLHHVLDKTLINTRTRINFTDNTISFSYELLNVDNIKILIKKGIQKDLKDQGSGLTPFDKLLTVMQKSKLERMLKPILIYISYIDPQDNQEKDTPIQLTPGNFIANKECKISFSALVGNPLADPSLVAILEDLKPS